MASKKYKGKICVYCNARLSEGRDHVFAREFFLPGTSYVAPVVPACKQCNKRKSDFEHYLTVVLPFGARHARARITMETMLPRRLERNAKLHQVLLSNRQLYVPTMALPIDFGCVEQLFQFVVRGLLWFHWRVRVTADEFVVVLALSKSGEEVFDRKLFRANVRAHVCADLGDGTVAYEGVQGIDNPVISGWKFSLYGGITLGCDPRKPNEGSSMIGAFTGPKRALRYVELMAKFGPGT